MKSSSFRRQLMSWTASATCAIVSIEQRPQSHSPPRVSPAGMLTTGSRMTSSSRGRSAVKFCGTPWSDHATAAMSPSRNWLTADSAMRRASGYSSGAMVRSIRITISRPSRAKLFVCVSAAICSIQGAGGMMRGGRSTAVNATTGRGLPSSSTVKSLAVRPRTGSRFLSSTETSTSTRSTPARNVTCGV